MYLLELAVGVRLFMESLRDKEKPGFYKDGWHANIEVGLGPDDQTPRFEVIIFPNAIKRSDIPEGSDLPDGDSPVVYSPDGIVALSESFMVGAPNTYSIEELYIQVSPPSLCFVLDLDGVVSSMNVEANALVELRFKPEIGDKGEFLSGDMDYIGNSKPSLDLDEQTMFKREMACEVDPRQRDFPRSRLDSVVITRMVQERQGEKWLDYAAAVRKICEPFGTNFGGAWNAEDYEDELYSHHGYTSAKPAATDSSGFAPEPATPAEKPPSDADTVVDIEVGDNEVVTVSGVDFDKQ